MKTENLKAAARTRVSKRLVYTRLSGPLAGVDSKSDEQRFQRRPTGGGGGDRVCSLLVWDELFSSEVSRQMYGPHIVCKSRNAICGSHKSNG